MCFAVLPQRSCCPGIAGDRDIAHAYDLPDGLGEGLGRITAAGGFGQDVRAVIAWERRRQVHLRAYEVDPALLEELERPQRVDLVPQRPDRGERVIDAVEREQRDHDVPR